MQTNDQTSSADATGKSKSAEVDSTPNGLVKGLLDSVLDGRDGVVASKKFDSSAQVPAQKTHEQTNKTAPENRHK